MEYCLLHKVVKGCQNVFCLSLPSEARTFAKLLALVEIWEDVMQIHYVKLAINNSGYYYIIM